MRLGSLAIFLTLAQFASASVLTFTSSSAFQAATTVTQTEDYHTLTNGQHIASGSTIDGFTYTGFVLTLGATQLDITNQYNSFTGLSLGADHTSGGATQTFFYGGEGATIAFAMPITAFGMFFNVNLNSGTFGFTTSEGSAVTGSASYDTRTFVFAGLVSTVPFDSISFSSTGADAVFNVTEDLVGAVPEPATFGLIGAGGILLVVRRTLRRKSPQCFCARNN